MNRRGPRSRGSLPPDLVRGSEVSRWQRPPEHLRRKVRNVPPPEVLPGVPARAQDENWVASDVRSGGVEEATTHMVSRVFRQAELGIFATPQARDGAWRIEGRVWLREPADAGDDRPIQVLLVHEDHVLARIECRDGEYFLLEEVVEAGWALEVHLPDGEALLLEDPTTP